MPYSQHVSTKKTPQSEPIPGTSQVENNAGGFVYSLDKWAVLERFLILGAEGGTYYATEKKLVQENAKTVIACIQANAAMALGMIVGVSTSGRAPKNDAAIFALALACTYGPKGDSLVAGVRAYDAIPLVCRTGTHLFQFVQAIQDLRGWSRGLRTGVGKWYTGKFSGDLEYQLLKYKQRDGWTHRDVLRLAHPKPTNEGIAGLLKYAVGKAETYPGALRIDAVRAVHAEPEKAALLVRNMGLTREMLPTECLNKKEVWAALLEGMPMHAMVRSLAKMTAVGLLGSAFDESVKTIVERLHREDLVKKSRLHPLAILNALRIYSAGKGEKGKLTWTPVQAVCDALNDAFYLAFANAPSTGKNFCLGLDVSGSMDGSQIAGTSLTAREATAALALVQGATETCEMLAFCHQLQRVNIGKNVRLDQAIAAMRQMPFGATNCALPMLAATEKKWPIDLFVIYTDSETQTGNIHPKQALDHYRQKMGRDAKLVVVGMTSTGFTIADPNDAGMMDCVGFDTNVPALISDFAGKAGVH